uniref:Uncharacterized protein n=1 Tax=Fagus sylvatica TaxID=28930 RepID=A0A2N9I4E0_FAGSY
MCSNTVSGGGNGGGNGCGWTSASGSNNNPPKRQKVPKRGPGVAELEKILREQENKDTTANIDGFSASLSSPYHHSHPQPPLPPPPPIATILHPVTPPFNASPSTSSNIHVGLVPHLDHFNGSSTSAILGSGMSSLVEKPLFPITWGSCKSDSAIPIFPTHISNACPSSNLLQRKNCQFSPTMVLGMKRPEPFSVDNSPRPQFHFRVPPMIDPRMARENQSSSSDNRSAYRLDPRSTISTFLRETRRDGPLDINSKKCITDFGASHLITICTHLAALRFLHPPQEVFKESFPNMTCFLSNMEDSHKRSGKGGSDSERPLHGLLQLKEQMGTKELTLSLNYERGEAGGEGIDLNLKL